MRGMTADTERLSTEGAFTVLARAKELERKGKRILHFEIGEPDFTTPGNIVLAAIKALVEGYTHYVPSQGILELREAVCEYISRTRNFEPKPEQVLVSPGAKPIIFYSILATVEPGDEVIYPDPSYPMYSSLVRYRGAKEVPIPLREEKEFRMTADDVNERVTNKTKMIILNSPHNPTGGVLTKEDVRGISEIAEDKDIFLLSDEVYSQLVYDGEHHSVANHDQAMERTILMDGFSKTWAMTGWRLGFCVAPPKLVERMTLIQMNVVSCACSFAQLAGVEGLLGSQEGAKKMREEFAKRREVIVKGLNEVPGFRCLKPRGAFYVFPNIRGTGKTSEELEKYLLEELGIATLSGTSFGPSGEGFLRFSYASSIETIKEGIEKLKEAF